MDPSNKKKQKGKSRKDKQAFALEIARKSMREAERQRHSHANGEDGYGSDYDNYDDDGYQMYDSRGDYEDARTAMGQTMTTTMMTAIRCTTPAEITRTRGDRVTRAAVQASGRGLLMVGAMGMIRMRMTMNSSERNLRSFSPLCASVC